MGRNNRRKNRWRSKNADKSRLGSGSGTPADSEDDPESYATPSSVTRRKRGSGKLRGGDFDDVATRITESKEVSSESPTKTNGDNEPPAGEGICAEEGMESAARTLAAVGLREEGQQQQQEEKVQHDGEIDETGGEVKEKERLDRAADATKKVTKEAGGGSGNGGDDTNSDLSAISCESPSKAPAPSACRAVIVPALPLGSSTLANGDLGGQAGLNRSAFGGREAKQYSLAWAGGKKGRPLMKSVEGVLSEWLCSQEAKVGNRTESKQTRYSRGGR